LALSLLLLSSKNPQTFSIEDFSGTIVQMDGKFNDDFVVVGFQDFDKIGVEAKGFQNSIHLFVNEVNDECFRVHNYSNTFFIILNLKESAYYYKKCCV